MVNIIDHTLEVRAEKLTKKNNAKKPQAPVVVEREIRNIIALGANVEAINLSFNVNSENNIPALIHERMERKFKNVPREGADALKKLNNVSPLALIEALEAAGFPLRGADWYQKGPGKYVWNTFFARHPKNGGAMKEFTQVKDDAFEEAKLLLAGKGLSAMIFDFPFFDENKEVIGKRCIVIGFGMYGWTTPNKELLIRDGAICVDAPKINA